MVTESLITPSAKDVLLKDVGTVIENAKTSILDSVFVFVSVDIVNSTVYKSEYKNWASTYSLILKNIIDTFTKDDPNWIFWKSIGDEVLFYKEIFTLNDLINAPSETYKYIHKNHIILSKNTDTKNKLYLKGAIWVARIEHEGSINTEKENSGFAFKNIILNDQYVTNDFMGENIDEGFRLARHTSQNKLAVDPKLCYIIHRYADKVKEICDFAVPDRYKIVAYRKLKGIFKERIYPIVWYSNHWNTEDLYLYDEHVYSDIVKEIKDSGYKYGKVSYLDKVLEHLNCKEECEKIIKLINSPKTPRTQIRPVKCSLLNSVELHLSVVCICKDSDGKKQALLLKRSSDRAFDRDKWEFGCAKATPKKNYKTCIEETYKTNFNIDIKLNCEPLHIYNIQRGPDLTHVGILFFSCFNKDNFKINTKDFTDVDYICEEGIDGFDGLMDGVKERLHIVFEHIKKNNIE